MSSETIDPDKPMTPAQAAEWLGLANMGYPQPEKTIREWASRRQIQSVKIGNRVAFTLRALRAYTERQLGGQRLKV